MHAYTSVCKYVSLYTHVHASTHVRVSVCREELDQLAGTVTQNNMLNQKIVSLNAEIVVKTGEAEQAARFKIDLDEARRREEALKEEAYERYGAMQTALVSLEQTVLGHNELLREKEAQRLQILAQVYRDSTSICS